MKHQSEILKHIIFAIMHENDLLTSEKQNEGLVKSKLSCIWKMWKSYNVENEIAESQKNEIEDVAGMSFNQFVSSKMIEVVVNDIASNLIYLRINDDVYDVVKVMNYFERVSISKHFSKLTRVQLSIENWSVTQYVDLENCDHLSEIAVVECLYQCLQMLLDNIKKDPNAKNRMMFSNPLTCRQ